jgi:hypothetical protein
MSSFCEHDGERRTFRYQLRNCRLSKEEYPKYSLRIVKNNAEMLGIYDLILSVLHDIH